MATSVTRLRAATRLKPVPSLPSLPSVPRRSLEVPRARLYSRTRDALRWVILPFTSAYALHMFIRQNVIDYSYPDGESMLMTLPNKNSMIFYSRLHANGKNIKLGDMIVERSPLFCQGTAGKRVVGMPGDYVVDDKTYDATVGGALHGGIRGNGGVEAMESEREEPRMRRVPEGHVWVVGDNLGWSRDSRFYGPVPMGLIVGKTVLMGDGWFNWRYVGGDWTDGQMKTVRM